MRVAVFDFDGTIYKKQTFGLLMAQLATHPTYRSHYNKFYFSILPTFIARKLRLTSEMKMRSKMMRKYLEVFKGLSKEEIIAYYEGIAESMQDDFNEEVLAAMAEHKADGMYIMLVSGAFTTLLEPVAGHLPIDVFIGTEIPYTNGIYDPDKPIHHIQADRKTEAIHKHLGNKEIDWENSFAYGDSYADLPVLEMVGNPVAVVPDDKLMAAAQEGKWKII